MKFGDIKDIVPLLRDNKDLLLSVSLKARGLYLSLLLTFDKEQFWDSSGEQSFGRLTDGYKIVRKADIIRDCNISDGVFYHGLWQELIGIGLCKEDGKDIILPGYEPMGITEMLNFLKKK